MKIVHIAPTSPYNDYWGYQDNLLPKYHTKAGHQVTLIVSDSSHADSGIVKTACDDYHLNDGTRVIRVKKKKYFNRILTNLNAKLEVYPILEEIKPDFIFFHGMISATLDDAVRYKKKISPECVIVQDNHMDYFNCPYNTDTIKGGFIRSFYRHINKRNEKYVNKIYGVTPWRKTFAEHYYGASPIKTDVLIMGADDENVDLINKGTIRRRIREENNISDDDFLIVTGGKVDKNKNIHHLMRVCGNIDRVKLLVFGNVMEDIRDEFNGLIEKYPNIIYIGWIDSHKVYDYFLAADLVVFPGSHSVLWEQACACKIPCVFKRWDGTEHVDNGGNSAFLDSVSEEALYEKIKTLIFTDEYNAMKKVAESSATDVYLYSKIAEKSLECFHK